MTPRWRCCFLVPLGITVVVQFYVWGVQSCLAQRIPICVGRIK